MKGRAFYRSIYIIPYAIPGFPLDPDLARLAQ